MSKKRESGIRFWLLVIAAAVAICILGAVPSPADEKCISSREGKLLLHSAANGLPMVIYDISDDGVPAVTEAFRELYGYTIVGDSAFAIIALDNFTYRGASVEVGSTSILFFRGGCLVEIVALRQEVMERLVHGMTRAR